MARPADLGLGAAPPLPAERDVGGRNVADRAWGATTAVMAGSVLIALGAVVLSLLTLVKPAAGQLHVGAFLTSTDWDPVQGSFGALPFVYGTAVTSAIAVGLALPVGVGLALFLSEMAPRFLRSVFSLGLEALAGIPSVVYGLWGLFVLVPLLRTYVEPALASALGFLPLFRGAPIGLGYLAAGLLLAVMILPTVASLSIEVLKTVPRPLREAALALGATRWETIRIAVLPYALPGILGAALLGLGRALGETMAATMVIGNSPELNASLFAPGYSLPAVIANEFTEATSDLHTAALAGLALVLLGVSVLLNALARLLVAAVKRRAGVAK